MSSKEGLVSSLPTNLATKVEVGIVLGRTMNLSRNNPAILGTQFFLVGDGVVELPINLSSKDIMHDVDFKVNLSGEERSNLKKRLGDEPWAVVSYRFRESGEEISSDESTGKFYPFGDHKVHSVWKPK